MRVNQEQGIGDISVRPPQGESIITDQSFPLKIWSGLFREKHWRAMGSAIWLFGMLLDKVTKEENGKGLVLGGAPVSYKTFAKDIPFSKRQYQRYLDKLREARYIHTHDTHHGLIIVIHKSKKFTRGSDKTGTGVVTETASPPAESGTGVVPDKALPLIDSTEDYEEREIHPQQYMMIWKMIHGAFKLPEQSYGAYKGDIIKTIQRLGFGITKKACEVFLKEVDDHPPEGKIKSLSQFLHWKKIDEYVAMITPDKTYRYFACLVCERVIKIEDREDIEQMLDRPSGKCTGPQGKPEKKHEAQRYVEITATIVDCQHKGMSKSQIRTVIDKHIETLRREK